MSSFKQMVCIIATAALPLTVAAQAPRSGMAQVEVPHRASVLAACTQGVSELPQGLYQAWRETDQASEALVQFKLEGTKVSDVTIAGDVLSHSAIRHAVRAMKCKRQGEGVYAIAFRIKFRYPEDADGTATAMQFSDVAATLAMLD